MRDGLRRRGHTPPTLGNLTFELQPQGLGTRLAELFGAKEITVGDAAFDAAWFIRTNTPESFGALLLPEIRTRFLTLHNVGGKGTVELARAGSTTPRKAISAKRRLSPGWNRFCLALEDLADAV